MTSSAAVPASRQSFSFWDMACRQLDTVAARMNLDPGTLARLRQCQRVLIVSIPVRMDDGHVEVFEGYRVQHNIAIGPYKGVIRFHKSVNLGILKFLAF